MRKRTRGWELPLEFTGQIKLSIRSFFRSFFSCSSPSPYCTHIPSGPTNSQVRHLSRPVILTVFWRLISGSNFFQICIFIISTFLQASFCSFSFTSYVFFSPPPSAHQLLTLSSKLTWAPSAIFSLSFCLPLCLCWSGKLRDVPTAHSAHFLSPNMGKKNSSQTRLQKK